MEYWNGNKNYGDGWPLNNDAKPAGSQNGDYELGMRIAMYLKGINSQGGPINWPQILGAGANGFTGKYTDRQLDSIALQILMMLKNCYLDHMYGYNLPMVITGFLSGKLVGGISRTPRATEVTLRVMTTAGDPPLLKMTVETENYFPAGFRGNSITNNNTGGDAPQWHWGTWNYNCVINSQDSPVLALTNNNTTIIMGTPAPLGGYWQNHLLDIRDQDDLPVGIDLYGNNPSYPDPDQASAKKYHPWTMAPDKLPGRDLILGTPDDIDNPYKGQYMGSGPRVGMFASVLSLSSVWPPNTDWNPGDYHYCFNSGAGVPSNAFSYPMRQSNPAAGTGPVTSIKLRGGLVLGIHNASGSAFGGNGVDVVPLESVRGSADRGGLDAPIVPLAFGDNDAKNFPDNLPDNQTKALLRAVIPIPMQADGTPYVIPIPGTAVFHMQVADPMVNMFPGDWVGKAWVGSAPPAGEITMTTTGQRIYQEAVGLNSTSKPSAGGDPLSTWFPKQSTTIAKAQRFPSAGYLQYIHTGMIPDKDFDANYNPALVSVYDKKAMLQKGTPFRLLNFSPGNATSQQTSGGSSYPDWALLDLFTVPAALQPLGGGAPINLTWGGATAGRINPNGTLYPFNILRTTPLKALVKGLQVSTSYSSPTTSSNATLTTIDDAAASVLANGICNYVTSLGRPLMLAGEICNVPEVAAYLYTGVAANAISRNDLVRQIVGNLSTRSNTYTVWAVGESVRKKPGYAGTNWGEFEPGDIVLGKSRTQYLIERYMDPGTDGVYGNAANPGPDGIVGTPDDPTTGAAPSAHPVFAYPIPYKYKTSVISQIDD